MTSPLPSTPSSSSLLLLLTLLLDAPPPTAGSSFAVQYPYPNPQLYLEALLCAGMTWSFERGTAMASELAGKRDAELFFLLPLLPSATLLLLLLAPASSQPIKSSSAKPRCWKFGVVVVVVVVVCSVVTMIFVGPKPKPTPSVSSKSALLPSVGCSEDEDGRRMALKRSATVLRGGSCRTVVSVGRWRRAEGDAVGERERASPPLLCAFAFERRAGAEARSMLIVGVRSMVCTPVVLLVVVMVVVDEDGRRTEEEEEGPAAVMIVVVVVVVRVRAGGAARARA